MESSPGLEFEFFLAEKLRMTVGEMRRKMSHAEFVHWGVYFGRKAQRQQMEMERARG